MTPADRIAALEAELAEVRMKYDAACKGSRERLDVLLAERAAHARTQAEAAAMRSALYDAACDFYNMNADHAEKRCSAALDGDAGRALAERVPLLEAVVDAARTLVTWKDHLAFGLNKQRVVDALAALDSDGTP